MNKNDIFYVCSLIESISRTTGLNKSQIVDTLGEKEIKHLYKFADVNHCLPIQQVTEEVINEHQLKSIANKKDYKNSIWDLGKVYQRLIVDVSNESNWIEKMIEIYHSFISKYLDDEEKPIYWQPRSYIKECYLKGTIL